MVTTEIKIALIEPLADAGLGDIEASCSACRKWVPPLADTARAGATRGHAPASKAALARQAA